MKKEGIVLKLDGKYLEVWTIEDSHCCNVDKDKSINEDIKQHDCSSCSGCSSLSSQKLKTIKVLNKSGKEIKVGEKISYSFNFIALQFFIIVLLPILVFGLTFFSLYLYSYREGFCILLSFLVFSLVISVNSLFTKKLFFPFV